MVQTFLPYPDFVQCARCLDITRLRSTLNEGSAMIYKALVQQQLVVQAMQWSWPTDANNYYDFIRELAQAYRHQEWKIKIDYSTHQWSYTTVLDPEAVKQGWWYHPAVLMWVGHLSLLVRYLNTLQHEYIHRGYNPFTFNVPLHCSNSPNELKYPEWWTDHRIFMSHQHCLFQKNPRHYFYFAAASYLWQVFYIPQLSRSSITVPNYDYFWPRTPHHQQF